MQPGVYILLLLLFLVPSAGHAESPSQNDRRNLYGNGLNNDGAAYKGDQQTQQQLTPPMMMHFQQADQYFQQAAQAAARGDMATAQQQNQMGQMEQMKGQQLQNQIQANKQTADQNRQSEDKVSNESEPPMAQAQLQDTQVTTVDKDRAAAKAAATQGNPEASGVPTPPPEGPPLPQSDEIATFEDYQAQAPSMRPAAAPTDTPSSAPSSVGPGAPPEPLGQASNQALGYDDSVAPRDPSAPDTSGAAAASSGASDTGAPDPQMADLSGAVVVGGAASGADANQSGPDLDDDFWKALAPDSQPGASGGPARAAASDQASRQPASSGD